MTKPTPKNSNKTHQNAMIALRSMASLRLGVCMGENGYSNPTPPQTEYRTCLIVPHLSRQSDAQLVPVRTFRLEPIPYAAGRVGQNRLYSALNPIMEKSHFRLYWLGSFDYALVKRGFPLH